MTLWGYEARRTGWAAVLGPPLAVALGAAAALAHPEPSDTTIARILLGGLEMAVPLAAAVVCSSLIGRDPARELQLAAPTPYRVTLLRRMAVVVGWAAVVATLTAAALIVTGWWARWPQSHGALAGQLTWLAPTVGLSGLGFAAGAVLRSPAAAGAIVTTVWAVQQFFAGAVQQHLPGRLLYLFATTRGATPGDWTANRLTLLGVGAVLIAFALVLLGRRPERLISEEDE
ncbi:hypothetical protein Aph02nite_94190 [Actinoplanes philippinensis]|uniref:ABC-2 type transport system permease protein n=1 Tax=Actinoplanes philippinensis TaxID=35752 RepID=A0A1I2N792_9ACTN|nr:hypothetical protein [Actinoplanes philippinensis]GIE83469.1 hypothetical protein Aph02nite_94190 [Actinoplanes philippinensis]SFF99734.1 hypothetical protein SAMN05421541_14017 [Actinoplanes philippinensis]